MQLSVTSVANAGPGSLRQAVEEATSGSTITIDPAIQGSTIDLMGEIVIDIGKEITIVGGSPGNETSLDAGGLDRIFRVRAGGHLDLSSVLLVNGSAPGGGGAIQVANGSAELTNVRISLCSAAFGGGGIHASNATLILNRVNILGCDASQGGGIHIERSDVHMTQSAIVLNFANFGLGGGISMAAGSLTARNSTVHGNNADAAGGPEDRGGGLYLRDNNLFDDLFVDIIGCTITSNTAMGVGGGIWVEASAASQIRIRQSIIADNVALSSPDMWHDDAILLESAYNLIGDGENSHVFNGLGSNQVGDAVTPLDPMLDVIQWGPLDTLYRPSLFASPVRDAVPEDDALDENDAALSEDQNGGNRLLNGSADIGSVDS